MTKKPNLRLSEDGRLADGGMRFVVRFPKELADLFEAEMKIQDRKKLPLVRFIVTHYFRGRLVRDEQNPESPAAEKSSGPHFGARPSLRQREAS